MEKISGILRSSPRLKAVDVSQSQPVRPGAPRFGRPEGKNSLGAANAPVQGDDLEDLSSEVDVGSVKQGRVSAALSDEAEATSSNRISRDAQMAKDQFDAPAARFMGTATGKSALEAVKTYDRNGNVKKANESAKTAAVKDLAAKFFLENPKTLARSSELAQSEMLAEEVASNPLQANIKSENVQKKSPESSRNQTSQDVPF